MKTSEHLNKKLKENTGIDSYENDFKNTIQSSKLKSNCPKTEFKNLINNPRMVKTLILPLSASTTPKKLNKSIETSIKSTSASLLNANKANIVNNLSQPSSYSDLNNSSMNSSSSNFSNQNLNEPSSPVHISTSSPTHDTKNELPVGYFDKLLLNKKVDRLRKESKLSDSNYLKIPQLRTTTTANTNSHENNGHKCNCQLVTSRSLAQSRSPSYGNIIESSSLPMNLSNNTTITNTTNTTTTNPASKKSTKNNAAEPTTTFRKYSASFNYTKAKILERFVTFCISNVFSMLI